MYNDLMPPSLCDSSYTEIRLKHSVQCLPSRKPLKVVHLIYSFNGINISVEEGPWLPFFNMYVF